MGPGQYPQCTRAPKVGGGWSFLGPGPEEKWYGTHSDKPDGIMLDRFAEKMMVEFLETAHQIETVPCFQRL